MGGLRRVHSSICSCLLGIGTQSYIVTDLGTFGGTYSQGFGINSNGQVTGVAYTSQNFDHAFIYTNGVMQDLGSISGIGGQLNGLSSEGSSINNAAGDWLLHDVGLSRATRHSLLQRRDARLGDVGRVLQLWERY